MDNYADYNDNKKVTYHEQTDISEYPEASCCFKNAS